jgi:Tfp pilus assembly protein PilE
LGWEVAVGNPSSHKDVPPGRATGAGFTLLELLGAIAIICILIALLLPAIQKVREVANRQHAGETLTQVLVVAGLYHNVLGHYPADVRSLVQFCQQGPACSLDPRLATGQLHGYSFFILKATDLEWRAEAEPAAPGLTGAESLFVDQGGTLTSRPTPGADAARRKAFEQILARGAEQIGDFMRLDPETFTFLQQPAFPITNAEVSGNLDHNGDQLISAQEIFDLGSYPPEAAPLMAEWLPYIENVLRMGAANEDLGGIFVPGVQEGDPRASFFNFDVLIQLTRSFAPERLPERSLVMKLARAQRTQDPALRQALVDAYIQELQRQVDINVSRGHEDILARNVIIAVLLPNPHLRGGILSGR